MPYANVGYVLKMPMHAQRLVIHRRFAQVDEHGRSVLSYQILTDPVGVVNVASPDELERLDDYDANKRYISVVTDFALRGPARQSGEPDSKPDNIEWMGTQYTITAIDPYPQYGAGFVQAIAGSVASIEEPMQ